MIRTPLGSAANENLPPTTTASTTLVRKPVAAQSRVPRPTLRNNNSSAPAASSRRSSPRLLQKPVAIQVQQPTSDYSGGDTSVEEDRVAQVPTPPNSQSLKSFNINNNASSSTLASTSAQLNKLLPPPPSTATTTASSRARSRSSSAKPRHSRSPSLNANTAPLHSPQVIAARRRSSVTPSSLAPPPVPQRPAASKIPSATTTKRRQSAKLKRLPTPTETLEAPIQSLDSDGEDPLLLRGGEEMRGWGEGRPSLGMSRRSLSVVVSEEEESGRSRRKSKSRSRSRSISTNAYAAAPSPPPPARLPVAAAVAGPSSEMHWNDEDLAPLGSGTIEENLFDEEEEDNYGGGMEHFAEDHDVGEFDLGAASQPQDSDDDDDFEQPSLTPQQDTPRQTRPIAIGVEYEYEVPIQAMSSSPPIASPRRSPFTRPSPFLSSMDPPSPFLTNQELLSPSTSTHQAYQPALTAVPSPRFRRSLSPSTMNAAAVIADEEVEIKQEEEEEAEVDEEEEEGASLLLPTPQPSQKLVWTRGPAFFRSSPSATMSTVSFPALTATSPDPRPTLDGHDDDDDDEEDEEEDEVVLIGQEERARSRSQSARASSVAQESTQNEQYESPPAPEVHMSSPAKTPTRPSPSADDIHMASPSPRRRSPTSASSASVSTTSIRSAERKLPATPPPELLAQEEAEEHAIDRVEALEAEQQPQEVHDQEADAHMASPAPSPAKRPLSSSAPVAFMPPPSTTRRNKVPPSVERLGASGMVTSGRTKLLGLFSGATASKPPSFPSTTVATAPAPQSRPSSSTPLASTSRQPIASTSRQPLQTPSLPTPQLRVTSTSSTLSTARRPRPSHPTLPVVEISSTDPVAAARAAAILKVYHDYVEQGLDVPGELLRGAGMVEREEEVLRSGMKPKGLMLALPSSAAAREESREPGTATPSSSRFAEPGTSSPGFDEEEDEEEEEEVSEEGCEWTPKEWRQLETALVEAGREARRAGEREASTEMILERFMKEQSIQGRQLGGAWSWDKLGYRVDAIRERRAKDRRISRASSLASTTVPRRAPRQTLDAELLQVNAPLPSSSSNIERSVSPFVIVKTEEVEEEEDDERSDSDSDSDRNVEDDTFFERAPTRKAVAPVEEEEDGVVHPPLALASSRFAHLYDDPIEKPRLPSQSWVPGTSADNEYDDEEYEEEEEEEDEDNSHARDSTPDNASREPSQAPSSAAKLFSYLGSFVRRSSAAPSSAGSPEPEMTQVNLDSSRVNPSFASTSQPFPTKDLPSPPTPPKTFPRRMDRKILPLRPSLFDQPDVVSDTSSSHLSPDTSTGSAASQLARRRRSSGEGRVWDQIQALEDAESSREEDARVIELLQSGGAKRRASAGDLRRGSAVTLASPAMVPSGTRALDRPIGEKEKKSRW